MIAKCPGALKFREVRPELIQCPSCSYEAEIWTDEVRIACPKCQGTIMRQDSASCIDWCRYAKLCLGDRSYNRYMKNKALTIKKKLIEELETLWGGDKRRITHSKNVMHFAEELLKQEGGDWHIVIPASILHDTGLKEGKKEDANIAQRILLGMGLKKEDIDEICAIIAHHHTPGKINSRNFKVLYDADRLVNLKDEVDIRDRERLTVMIDKVFLTNSGKMLAEKVYLQKK